MKTFVRYRKSLVWGGGYRGISPRWSTSGENILLLLWYSTNSTKYGRQKKGGTTRFGIPSWVMIAMYLVPMIMYLVPGMVPRNGRPRFGPLSHRLFYIVCLLRLVCIAQKQEYLLAMVSQCRHAVRVCRISSSYRCAMEMPWYPHTLIPRYPSRATWLPGLLRVADSGVSSNTSGQVSVPLKPYRSKA